MPGVKSVLSIESNVLLTNTTQFLRWVSYQQPLNLKSSTLSLRQWAPWRMIQTQGYNILYDKKNYYIWATTCDFQQCSMLTSVDSDEQLCSLLLS